jgi:uncharacterized protein YaeQ
VSSRYVFNLASEDRRRALPAKILLPRADTETLTHILLKLFGYLLFYRDRVQLEPRLDDDYLPFVPDVVQLDYEGRVALWVECGECALAKLDRLAVKAPYAEIWAVKRSEDEAAELARAMAREGLRKGRYGIVGLDAEMLAEVAGLARARNDVRWYRGTFEPAGMQFEFNGLWFEAGFTVRRH